MIKSFRDRVTSDFYDGLRVPRFHAVEQQARRRLRMLDAAVSLNSLRLLPSNCLETLVGDRKGEHSIRINKQWRICFTWKNNHAYSVQVVDYH